MRVAAKEIWEVEPYVRAGPLAAGSSLDEFIEAFGEEPRCFPQKEFARQRCQFVGHGILTTVGDDHVVEEIEFITRGSIVPVYCGIRLLGNWKSARTQLAELGIATPEPDKYDEQTIVVTDRSRGVESIRPRRA